MRPYTKYLFMLLALFVIFVFGSCSSGFLSDEELKLINYNDKGTNSIVYYNKTYTIIDDKNLESETHYLLKVGKNDKTLPKFLSVFDGTVLKLENFNVKIIKANGSTKYYSESDLFIQNLSNSRIISESFVKFLPLQTYISYGDLIEIVYSHKTELGSLGIIFSLDETEFITENISCSIQIPTSRLLKYKVINDTINPEIKKDDNSLTYTFKWKTFNKKNHSHHLFEKENDYPGILATSYPIHEGIDSANWVSFGNWYLDLIDERIHFNEMLKQQAGQIVKGCTTDKEKIDAIFKYCQKNIRYEQVYLDKGEIIPNSAEMIYKRGFGDCKDYSTIIYSLARSIGLNPHLALCYRGRGIEFHPDMAVDQFNHIIVHFENDGKNYWYDGTNRIGIPGITTNDLTNQYALILEKDKSKIVKIQESQNNLFSVSGKFKSKENDLWGELILNFNDQFAVDYFFADYFLSRADMKDFLIKSVKNHLNGSLLIDEIKWKSIGNNFNLIVKCEIPNAVIDLEDHSYISFVKLFPSLIIADTSGLQEQIVFYYPNYNIVNLDIILEDFFDANKLGRSPFRLQYSYKLPAGPFDADERLLFINNYKSVLNELAMSKKIFRNNSL